MLAFRSTHPAKIAVVFCALLCIGYYSVFRESNLDYHNVYKIALTGKKAFFIDSAKETAIDGPFDNSTLVELCAGREWQEGLIIKCEPPYGDAFEVRNVYLNCVRFAIEAGATGFIVPESKAPTQQLSKRDSSAPHTDLLRRITKWADIKDESQHSDKPKLRPEPAHVELVPFTHFFDSSHFAIALSQACPQMKIFSHVNDLYDMPSTGKVYSLAPERLTKSFYPRPASSVLAVPSEWRPTFDDWLNETCPVPTASRPILVSLTDPYLQFPLAHDPPQFVAQFGKLIRSRPDVREIAATILFAMNKAHLTLGYKPTHGIQKRKYYGAHVLLNEEQSGFLGLGKHQTVRLYKTQAESLINAATGNHLSLIYLSISSSVSSAQAPSSNNPTPISTLSQHPGLSRAHISTLEKFTKEASNHSLTVHTRSSLLSDPRYSTAFNVMTALPCDIQDLIDYEVLLKSSIFGGSYESPLAWNVAMRRHVVWGHGTWKPLEAGAPGRRGKLDAVTAEKLGVKVQGEISFEDGGSVGPSVVAGEGSGKTKKKHGLSVVFGPEEQADGAFANALWP